MTRYVQRTDNEGWVVTPGEVFKIACCDCGLVHQVVIVVEGGKVGIAARRDRRATGQRRRKRESPVAGHGRIRKGEGGT